MKHAAYAALFLALLGCGDGVSPVAQKVTQQLSDLNKPDTYGQLLPSITPERIEKFTFRLVYFNVPSQRSETFMRPFGNNAGMETWIGAKGTSIYLKDGVIFGSRGYGDDLAIAARPTWAEIKQHAARAKPYSARYQHWSAQETLVTQSFTCNAAQRGKRISEICKSDQGQSDQRIGFENTYEMNNAGEVLASRQWLSRSIGYAEIRRLK